MMMPSGAGPLVLQLIAFGSTVALAAEPHGTKRNKGDFLYWAIVHSRIALWHKI
jgi:hypothetical protein